MVAAFDAATGTPLWSRVLSNGFMVGVPVAAGGIVYVVVGGVLHALDENTGADLWHVSPGGDPTSVAYSSSLLALEYIEGTLYAYEPKSGASLWHTSGCCTGGGGDVPVIYREHVFALDFWSNNLVLDLQGNSLGTFIASAVPAFENGLGFFLNYGTLEGRDLNGDVKWSFAGDGTLSATPLAVGGAVYQGSSSGKLYALDEQSGQVQWEEDVGVAIPGANQTNGFFPTTGLGASGELLVVPTSATVFAYGN
jgi:outer membrane protein assembly factor BamB